MPPTRKRVGARQIDEEIAASKGRPVDGLCPDAVVTPRPIQALVRVTL